MTFKYGIKYILLNNDAKSPTLTGRTFLIFPIFLNMSKNLSKNTRNTYCKDKGYFSFRN